MAQTLCRIAGVVFLVAGLAGFAMPHLLGFHRTPIHNVVHIATGAAALYFGFAAAAPAARTFCLAFGAVYLLLGVLGFLAPGVVSAVIGHAPLTAGELTPDNAFHVLVGAAFLFVGLTSPRAAA
jgi:hypothetical protein